MSRSQRFPNPTLLRLVLSAMLLALGLVLPFLTGQVPQIGSMLLPMHLPVFLCGLICGWQYGGAIGLILPLLRSLLFGMPPLYPTAVAMAVELAVYGVATGLFDRLWKKKNLLSVYGSLLPAMLLGRVAWGGAQILLLGLQKNPFTWQMFAAGAFINAVPGIILQLILIPAIIEALRYSGALRKLDT